MRFTTLASVSALVGAAGASAQLASPMDLINYVSALLSPSCKATLQGVVANNSAVSQCLNIPGLFPILNSTSNGTIVPLVNTYLQSTCGLPACSDALVTNTTQQVLSACSTDLSNFGISNNTVQIIMHAYPTARKIVCLSTNSTQLSNSTTVGFNSTSNSTLCPIAFLDEVQSYLGVPLSTRYLTSLVLGGNATAYNAIKTVVNNRTLTQHFVCNDCVNAAVDIVLEDYPQLETTKFSLGNSSLASNLNSTSYTLGQFYQGLCGVPVGANVSLPASINETAFNVTVGTNKTSGAIGSGATPTKSSLTSSTGRVSSSIASILPVSGVSSAASAASTAVAARSVQEAKKRFVRWE